MSSAFDRSAPPPIRPLTAREADCLRWIAYGKSNSEIAAIFKISESSVEMHIKRSLSKLGTKSIVLALAKAIRHDFIRL